MRTDYMSKRIAPEGWSVVKVKDIFDRVRNPVEVNSNEKYTQIGIRSHGKGIFYKEPVTGEQLGNKSVYWVEPDCFIVNIVFAWEMAVARTTDKDKGYIASHRFPMYLPKKDIVDLDFITYLFKSSRGKHLLNLASPGGAGRNKTLGQKEFEEIEILLPSNVEEQKKISLILSTFDRLTTIKEKITKEKKIQKNGLMQQLMNREVMGVGIKDEWESLPIEKICTLNMGKTPSRNNEKYWGKGYKWIAISDLKEKYIINTKEEITELAVRETGIKMIPKDTVIMSFKLSLGKLGITSEDMYSNEAIISFTNRNKTIIDNEFLYYYLSSIDITKYGSRAAKGITLNKDSLKEIIVRFPSIKEQIEIRRVLATFDKEISLLEKELDLLKQQKQGLMQNLLTGKIRVKV